MSSPPTAIFAASDAVAWAAITAALRRGLRVPEDLTVCGFGDSESFRSLWPNLTTIGLPVGKMFNAAVKLLLRAIEARKGGWQPKPQRMMLDFKLVRGESDGPPRTW